MGFEGKRYGKFQKLIFSAGDDGGGDREGDLF
jgi:hypothetical protein